MTTPERPPRVENKERLKLRILVAEDDPTLQKTIVRALEKFGHAVDFVTNGQMLLDKLAVDNEYDLVISDKNMPIMDGITALIKIRELYGGKIRVIIDTSDELPRDIVIMRALGATYLKKPFELEELKNAIRKAIEGV